MSGETSHPKQTYQPTLGDILRYAGPYQYNSGARNEGFVRNLAIVDGSWILCSWFKHVERRGEGWCDMGAGKPATWHRSHYAVPDHGEMGGRKRSRWCQLVPRAKT